MTDYVTAYERPGHVYHSEALRVAASLRLETDIAGGVIRWQSNGNVPPAECVLLAAHIGLPINVGACSRARGADVDRFLAAYRQANANGPSDEERFAARAAFGAGASVVNVVTGFRFRT